MRILVADDERDLNALIAQKLRKEHYSVDCCHDGEEALEYLRMADYDAVVLDIMMPKKDGISVLKELRANGSHVPVLLLTAKDSIEDRVLGLDAGADDYLIKPFAYEELMARLRVLLRSPLQNKTSVLQVGDLTLHLDTHQVQRAGKDIALSSKEYALLSYMMQNAGTVLSRAISSSLLMMRFSGAMDMVTSATPFAGIDWFIVSIFAPDSVKIESTEASLPGLSCSLMWNVMMASRFISRKGVMQSLYL